MNRRNFFRSLGVAALGAAARVYAPAALDDATAPMVVCEGIPTVYKDAYEWSLGPDPELFRQGARAMADALHKNRVLRNPVIYATRQAE